MILFSQQFNPEQFLGALSNFGGQHGVNGLNCQNTNDASAVQKILSALKKSSSLTECLSSIQVLSEYLSCESENVRNIAAQAIVSLVVKAVKFLSKENNPDVIRETSVKLLQVIEQLNQSNVSLGTEGKNALNEAREIIIRKLVETSQDKFVSSGQPSSSNNNTDRFQCSLNQTMNNLSGGMSNTDVANSLTRIRRNLIGDGSNVV